jgi:GNAT superfamily N-acetyltransferase
MPIPIANAVWSDGPDEEPVLRDLAEALGEIEARGAAPAVVAVEGWTPRVQEAARALGLTLEERVPGMTLAPEGFRPPGERPDVELRRMTDDPAMIEVALDVTARGFEVPPEVVASLFATGMQAEGLDVWLAYVGDEPVSTALGVVRGGAVGIFDVATPPAHRRKGYGAFVTAKAVAAGLAAGAAFAYLQSSEMGFHVYEALGFQTVSTYVVHSRPEPL